jgi:hypothetical protein
VDARPFTAEDIRSAAEDIRSAAEELKRRMAEGYRPVSELLRFHPGPRRILDYLDANNPEEAVIRCDGCGESLNQLPLGRYVKCPCGGRFTPSEFQAGVYHGIVKVLRKQGRWEG